MTFLQPQLKQGLGKPSTHTTSPLSPSEKIPQADPLVTGPNPPPHTAGAIFQEPLSWGLGSSYKKSLGGSQRALEGAIKQTSALFPAGKVKTL